MTKKNLIEIDTVITRRDGLISADMGGGETVMMSMEKDTYYGMDTIGSRIWELIEQPVSVYELHNILLEQYDIDRETCQRDILDFLNELNNEGILKIVDEPANEIYTSAMD